MPSTNLNTGSSSAVGAKPEDRSLPEDLSFSDSPAISQPAQNELVQTLQAEKFRLETLVCYLLQLNEQLREKQSHSTIHTAATSEAAEETES